MNEAYTITILLSHIRKDGDKEYSTLLEHATIILRSVNGKAAGHVYDAALHTLKVGIRGE